MIWLGPAFLVAVAIGIVLDRRRLAHLQAMVLGGSVVPGCVVVEAVVLALIAAALLVLGFRQ
jgi:hypothetical protein